MNPSLPLGLDVQQPYAPPKLKLRPLREQPATRVAQDADACNLLELLAAVVGGPQQIEIAENLLSSFGDIDGLQRAHISEISDLPGIGQSTAARLKAALTLGKRLAMHVPEQPPAIHSPADAAALVQYEMSALEQEHLRVLVLNTRNRLLEIAEVYHGSVNQAQVRVAEVLRPAVRRNAPAIIVAHNHPSGDPTPSPDDIAITRAIVEAGKLLDVSLLDHLIIGQGRWVSLKERNLGFDGNVLHERCKPYQVRDGAWDDAEVIFAYTRAQALEDGVLVNVSEMAAEAGFRFPTAISQTLYATLTPNETERNHGQSYDGRLWDVLFMAAMAGRKSSSSRVAYEIHLAECEPGDRRLRRRVLKLLADVGPGDQGEPVITIGFPKDF